MRITKAVVTAAGRNQRNLPLQTLIDRDGIERSVLGILVEEALSAGIDRVAVVVAPGDESAYADVIGDRRGYVTFIAQERPMGYGHAIHCAQTFVGDDPFLHLVGDHLYVSQDQHTCAYQLVEVAQTEACAVSAVQATRETLLPYYGTVGGRRLPGRKDLYAVDTVVEKPTPTEAELTLIVPGLRAGHYLCFFGMHVLTPTLMGILAHQVAEAMRQGPSARGSVQLSTALAALAGREKYLALEQPAQRYDVGVKYGLLTAQVALALSGRDRDEVLTRLLELLTARELGHDSADAFGPGEA
jgi:UTP--glucose-1-phosphate uridylyltransferase